MPPELTRPTAAMVAEAKTRIREITAADALALVGDDAYRFIDIRDVRELAESGRVPGSFHCPRGMIEFWIDPASPYYKSKFFDEENKTYVVYCAGGMRSALTTDLIQQMGFGPVMHISDGFGGWLKAGGPVEKRDPPEKKKD